MSLRRKSTVKNSSKKSPRTVEQSSASSVRRPLKAAKRPHLALIDPNLDQFLDPSSIAKPPIAASTEDTESAFRKVEEAKQRLGNLECEIISALFPATGDPESFEALAARLGMSVKEVREVADNALRGLRGTKGSLPRPSSVWN
jgi:hypothetical protein